MYIDVGLSVSGAVKVQPGFVNNSFEQYCHKALYSDT